MMDDSKKDDNFQETIRKMIDDQIGIIRGAVMGEGAAELAKTAQKIFANLPEDEFTDDKKLIDYKQLYFTVNNDVGLMLKYGDNLYWFQGDYVIRVKKTKAGTTHEAFKKRKLIASDVLPPSRTN
jgi:hypothetical protein